MRQQRKKIWIDRLQTLLAVRIAVYLLIYQLAVWSLVLFERFLSKVATRIIGPGVPLSFSLFPVILLALLVGCCFVRDALKVAHRVVGPLYRFRQTIKAIAAGEDVQMVRLRDGDFLQEMKDEFNEMLRVLRNGEPLS